MVDQAQALSCSCRKGPEVQRSPAIVEPLNVIPLGAAVANSDRLRTSKENRVNLMSTNEIDGVARKVVEGEDMSEIWRDDAIQTRGIYGAWLSNLYLRVHFIR